MYSEKHFQVRMDPRPEGLWVVVAHPATGWELTEGPLECGGVKPAVQRLIRAIRQKLAAPEDLRIHTGLAIGGEFLCVEHLPTGRFRSLIHREASYRVQERLTDELIAELWDYGLLSDPQFAVKVREG